MMKKLLLIVALGLFSVFPGANDAFADCPDYKLRCVDGSWHGPYGTCWKWSDFMCVPCEDHGSVCNAHGGPKCLWFSSAIEEVALAIACRYLHIPNDMCVICEN